MSQKEKLYEKVKSGPKNVTIDEIRALMSLYGFTYRKTRHGYFFKHEKLKDIILPTVPKPHGRENKVLANYVNRCLAAIELLSSEWKEQ